MERWIQNTVSRQIKKGKIPESEAEIYEYGYRLMIEKVGAFLLTVLIALLFCAWQEVILFCIAFVPLRVYSGGYHAKKTISCMILSGTILVLNVFVVKGLNLLNIGQYLIILEIFLFVLLYRFSPVETENRKIEESERKYFKKMILIIFLIEILLEAILIVCGKGDWINSFVVAHGVNIVTVLVEVIRNGKVVREWKVL